MKKAHIETDTGKLLGWYEDKIHGIKIPHDGCIEVSDDTWSKALEISANAYVDGEFIVKYFRSEEEVIAGNLKNKIAKANSYLEETEWIENYKLRNDLGLEAIASDSAKWSIIKQREEYKAYLKSL